MLKLQFTAFSWTQTKFVNNFILFCKMLIKIYRYIYIFLDAEKKKNVVIFDDSDDDLDMDQEKREENKETEEQCVKNSEKNANGDELGKDEDKTAAEKEKTGNNSNISIKQPESNNPEEALKSQQTLVDYLKVCT